MGPKEVKDYLALEGDESFPLPIIDDVVDIFAKTTNVSDGDRKVILGNVQLLMQTYQATVREGVKKLYETSADVVTFLQSALNFFL